MKGNYNFGKLFRPKYILMPGIAAGIDETEQLYGDVVLADMVWNYSNGKYVTKDRGETKSYYS